VEAGGCSEPAFSSTAKGKNSNEVTEKDDHVEGRDVSWEGSLREREKGYFQ